MLNKKICVRCVRRVDKHEHDPVARAMGWYPMDNYKQSFDEAWKSGTCQCPKADLPCLIPVDGPPPERCPYTLEHIVNTKIRIKDDKLKNRKQRIARQSGKKGK